MGGESGDILFTIVIILVFGGGDGGVDDDGVVVFVGGSGSGVVVIQSKCLPCITFAGIYFKYLLACTWYFQYFFK